MKKIACLLLLAASSICCYAQSNFARQGVIDLRQYDFAEGAVKLEGEWEFYMSELLSPADISALTSPRDYQTFPSVWNDISKSLKPGYGFATYHLKALVNKAPIDLALEIPHVYSNYKLWVNNNVIASNGVVGVSPETSSPQWLPQTVSFRSEKDTLDIVLQISNFHHAKGGIREDIQLGNPDSLLKKRQVAVTSNLGLMISLIVLSVAFVLVYLIIRSENAALYFAALCITWAIRAGFSNLYIVTSFMPDFPWDIAVRIEYITLYLTMIWAVCFISSVFPHDISQMFKYLFVSCNIIFCLLTAFLSPGLFTQFLPVYLSFSAILLLYIIYVLIHAIIYERNGVWVIVSCFMVGVIVFGYDIVSYHAFADFNSILINTGYVVMFILMAIGLSLKLELIKKNARRQDMLTYEDLYGGTRK